MGAGGEDIQLSESARRLFRYGIECKNRVSMAVYRDFEQAERHCDVGNLEPCLIIKQNHSEPLAVVSLKHFMELVSARSSGV